MNIANFVKLYNENKIELKEIMKSENYVPHLTKIAYAKDIVAQATTVENGIKYIDMFVVGINKAMTYIQMYTTLEVSKTTLFTDFDLLCSNKLLDAIADIIDEDEFDCFDYLVEIAIDAIEEKQTLQSQLAKQVTRFGVLVGSLAKTSLSELSSVIEKIDMSEGGKLTAIKEKVKDALSNNQ